MRNLIILLLVCFGYCFGQEKQKEEDRNPCRDPPISYARKFGVKGLTVKDLPHYFKVSKACKEKGGEVLIDQISINEYNRDFQQSKFMETN